MPKVSPKPGDLISWLRRLERRVKNLEGSPRLRNASIRGGTLTILDDTGVPILRVGDLPYANEIGVQTYDPTDGSRIMFSGYVPGNGDTEFIVRREDGSAALEMYNGGQGAGSPQFIAMLDRQGNFVASDDTDTGYGMATPWVSYYVAPDVLGGGSDNGLWMQTTSGGWQSLWQLNAPIWHPWIHVRVLAWGNNCTGRVRLYDTTDGRQIGSTSATVASGSAVYLDFDVQVLDASHSSLKLHELRVEGTRDSGTGTLQTEVMWAYGSGT